MCMSKPRVKDTKDGKQYAFATKAKAEAYGLDKNIPIFTAFSYTQTTYTNYLYTYTYREVNTAIQHVTKHLALT